MKPDHRPTDVLLNLKQLAQGIGVPYYFTLAMKAAGLVTPGRRVTEQDARDWLKENLSFVPNQCRSAAAGTKYQARKRVAAESDEADVISGHGDR
jgi:hypothetical protein